MEYIEMKNTEKKSKLKNVKIYSENSITSGYIKIAIRYRNVWCATFDHFLINEFFFVIFIFIYLREPFLCDDYLGQWMIITLNGIFCTSFKYFSKPLDLTF